MIFKVTPRLTMFLGCLWATVNEPLVSQPQTPSGLAEHAKFSHHKHLPSISTPYIYTDWVSVWQWACCGLSECPLMTSSSGPARRKCPTCRPGQSWWLLHSHLVSHLKGSIRSSGLGVTVNCVQPLSGPYNSSLDGYTNLLLTDQYLQFLIACVEAQSKVWTMNTGQVYLPDYLCTVTSEAA